MSLGSVLLLEMASRCLREILHPLLDRSLQVRMYASLQMKAWSHWRIAFKYPDVLRGRDMEYDDFAQIGSSLPSKTKAYWTNTNWQFSRIATQVWRTLAELPQWFGFDLMYLIGLVCRLAELMLPSQHTIDL